MGKEKVRCAAHCAPLRPVDLWLTLAVRADPPEHVWRLACYTCCLLQCFPAPGPDTGLWCSVVIGHVDSGKSTTTGHLIYKLGA